MFVKGLGFPGPFFALKKVYGSYCGSKVTAGRGYGCFFITLWKALFVQLSYAFYIPFVYRSLKKQTIAEQTANRYVWIVEA
jgi:hypothetical protein